MTAIVGMGSACSNKLHDIRTIYTYRTTNDNFEEKQILIIWI
jgi:hypothetical protein